MDYIYHLLYANINPKGWVPLVYLKKMKLHMFTQLKSRRVRIWTLSSHMVVIGIR